MPAADIVEAGGRRQLGEPLGRRRRLRARGVHTVLMVTDPFHEDRSMAIASALGLTPYPTPTQTSPITGLSTVPYFLKEALGVGLGRVIGFQHLHALGLEPGRCEARSGGPGAANLAPRPFGGGVIGNTTGSGPVIEGSSPSPRAQPASRRPVAGCRAPSSRGQGHHPLKVETRVRIPLGLPT